MILNNSESRPLLPFQNFLKAYFNLFAYCNPIRYKGIVPCEHFVFTTGTCQKNVCPSIDLADVNGFCFQKDIQHLGIVIIGNAFVAHISLQDWIYIIL